MIDFGPIDELRETRRRLSAECGYDVHRYAEMLRDMASKSTAKYVTQPFLTDASRTLPSQETPAEPVAASPSTPPSVVP